MRRFISALGAAILAVAMALSTPTTQAKCAEFPTFLELGKKLPNAAIAHVRVTAVTQEERRYGSRNVTWPIIAGEVVNVLRGTLHTRTLRGSGDPFDTAGSFNIKHYSVGSEWVVWVTMRADRPKDTMWSDVDFWLGGCGQSALRVDDGRVHYYGSMTLEEFRAVIRRVLP